MKVEKKKVVMFKGIKKEIWYPVSTYLYRYTIHPTPIGRGTILDISW